MLQSNPPAPQSIHMKVLKRTTVVFLLLVLCVFVVEAQSGRRQTKPAPAAPVPTPTPEPTPPPKSQQKEPDIIFFIGVDRNQAYSYYPSTYYDAVLSGCAEALRHSSAGVDVSRNELSRGEAIKKSKASTNTYTVLLQFSDSRVGSTSSTQRDDQLELEYVVFAPGTAKVVTSGRTYQSANRKGPVVMGPTGGGSTSGLYREALLNKAGQDAGERILRALHISVPKTN
jgi:hypothetical protein